MTVDAYLFDSLKYDLKKIEEGTFLFTTSSAEPISRRVVAASLPATCPSSHTCLQCSGVISPPFPLCSTLALQLILWPSILCLPILCPPILCLPITSWVLMRHCISPTPPTPLSPIAGGQKRAAVAAQISPTPHFRTWTHSPSVLVVLER